MMQYTGDRSIMQGAIALGQGISAASGSLGDSIAKEQDRIQKQKDELDAFKGIGEYMSRNGEITQEDLAMLDQMPLSKAKSYMTGLVADATRRKEAMTAEKLASIRAGRDNGIIYDRGRAYRLDANNQPVPLVSGDAPVRQVPVIDPTTGQIKTMVPEGAIMARTENSPESRTPSEYTASTGEKFIMGPQGQMVQINRPQPEQPKGMAIGTIIPTPAGDIVVKGFDKNGQPETQLVIKDDKVLAQEKINEEARRSAETNRNKILGQAAEAEAQAKLGNMRPGPDFLPVFEPYTVKAARLRAEAGSAPQSQPAPARAAAPAAAMSAQDQQALAWAKQNPNDPRAAAIIKRLGM